MFKSVKKVLVGALAASLLLSNVVMAAGSATEAPVISNAGGAKVTVSKDGKTATVTSVKTTKKAATINAIKVGGKAVNVKIGANAIKKGTKKVTIKATKKVTVNKKAFAKLSKKQKAAVKVYYSKKMSKANVKTLKAQLKNAGISAKNIIKK